MPAAKREQAGVTLLELLVTVAVLTISLTIGVPSFRHIFLRADRTAVVMEMSSAVSLARSEAGRRTTPVTICATADGATCTASDNRDWSGGWLVFTDKDADHLIDNGVDELLSVTRFDSTRFEIEADGTIGAAVTYAADGFIEPDQVGTLSYCDPETSRDLELTLIGRLDITIVDAPCSP